MATLDCGLALTVSHPGPWNKLSNLHSPLYSLCYPQWNGLSENSVSLALGNPGPRCASPTVASHLEVSVVCLLIPHRARALILRQVPSPKREAAWISQPSTQYFWLIPFKELTKKAKMPENEWMGTESHLYPPYFEVSFGGEENGGMDGN